MICPKCGREYEDGSTRCSDCDIDLVKRSEYGAESRQNDKIVTGERNLVKVKNVSDDFEAWTIIDLLEKHNIPCIKKEREAGSYLKIAMGYSVYGADIYVDEQNYDEAMELINSLQTDAGSQDDQTDGKEATLLKIPKFIMRGMLILILISIILLIISRAIPVK